MERVVLLQTPAFIRGEVRDRAESPKRAARIEEPIARAHEARIAGALVPGEMPQLIDMLDRVFAALQR